MQVEDTRVQNIPKWIIKEMCDMYEIVFMKITFKQMSDVSYNINLILQYFLKS